MREARRACGRSRGATGRARSRRRAARRERRRSSSPPPCRSRARTAARRTAHAALSARCPEIGATVSRPQRRLIAQRAKPSASPNPPPTRRAERRHRDVSLAALDRPRERAQLARRLAQVAVAQHEDRVVSEPRVRCRAPPPPPASRRRPCRSRARCAPHARRPHARSRRSRRSSRRRRRTPRAPGKARGERGERRADPLGLVVGGRRLRRSVGSWRPLGSMGAGCAKAGRRCDGLSDGQAIVLTVSDDRRSRRLGRFACPR